MQYPHKRFLRFLLSKRLEHYTAMAECINLDLLPPNETDYADLSKELGVLPASWEPKLSKNNAVFRKWLVEQDLYDMWVPDEDIKAAFEFARNLRLRKSFESLLLLHGDIEHCRAEMLVTYPAQWVPVLPVLEIYCATFWDLASMDRGSLFDFLEAQQDSDVQVQAYGGQQEYTYARLGLKQKVSSVDFLDSFIQLAKLQNTKLLREGGTSNGHLLAGTAALGRAAMDAVSMREELLQTTAESDMRREAAIFKAEIIKDRPHLIPSIDELRRDVIDAEPDPRGKKAEASGGSLVRLPTGGRPPRSTT